MKKHLPFLKIKNIVFVEKNSDKYKVCQNLKVKFMIDDSPEIFDFFPNNSQIKPILFGVKKTAPKRNLNRAKDWKSIFELIKKFD
ncbi:MAG: hypothetical protein WCX70_00585 [Candidatus Paceibacterota bacterium]